MKLFITDYDGTLFVNEKEIKKTNNKLKRLKKKGFIIAIATGRSYPSIKNQMNIYNIPYDYLCCADGSVIYDSNGNLLKAYYMNQEIIKPYQDFYQKLNFEEIQFVYPEGYANILKDDNSQLLGINICLSTANYTTKIVNNFIKMSKYYPKYSFLNYMHPNYSYLCVKPKGISKSAAINFLINYTNTLVSDVYVIGDSYNDYEMIRDYSGYAIQSSCAEILKIAKKTYKKIDNFIDDLLRED